MLWWQQQCFCPFVLHLKDGYSIRSAPFAAAKVVGEWKTKDLTWANSFTREWLVKVLLNDVELMPSTNYTPNNIITQQEQNVFSGGFHSGNIGCTCTVLGLLFCTSFHSLTSFVMGFFYTMNRPACLNLPSTFKGLWSLKSNTVLNQEMSTLVFCTNWLLCWSTADVREAEWMKPLKKFPSKEHVQTGFTTQSPRECHNCLLTSTWPLARVFM